MHATLANDTIDLVLDEMIRTANAGGEFYNMLKSIDKEEKQKMITEILNPYVGNLVVTPKEIDMVINSVSKIIANGLILHFNQHLDLEDINKYLN